MNHFRVTVRKDNVESSFPTNDERLVMHIRANLRKGYVVVGLQPISRETYDRECGLARYPIQYSEL